MVTKNYFALAVKEQNYWSEHKRFINFDVREHIFVLLANGFILLNQRSHT